MKRALYKLILLIFILVFAPIKAHAVQFELLVLPTNLFSVCDNYFCFPEVSEIVAEDVIFNLRQYQNINTRALADVRAKLYTDSVLKTKTESVLKKYEETDRIDFQTLQEIAKVFDVKSVLLISCYAVNDKTTLRRNLWDVLEISSAFKISYPFELKTNAVLTDMVNNIVMWSGKYTKSVSDTFGYYSASNQTQAMSQLEKIKQYLSLLQPDGSFADINYKDKKRTSWQPKQHTERALELCKLYASDTTPLYHDKQIEKQIHQILGFWFKNMPECSNWWQNEIGIPRTLGQAFLIFEDQLNEEERNGALSVMNKAHFGMTGQNKVWLASNMMIKGLLTDDELLVKQARDTIVSEITTEGVDGIQPDWSYHLHGPQQQFGNYGLAFLSSMSFFYKLFENTSYQLTDHQRSILVNLVENGYKWVIWHRHMDISSLGRQLFMHASTHKGYMTAFCAQDLGISGFPLGSNPLVGHKHFPYSDYTIHRTPTWMASVKMHSCRTIGSEHVNEDNIRGFYLGDGATYFYMDKDDYMDALPCWDWRKVPGTTAYESDIPVDQKYRNERNSSSMVGGVSEGMYGVSAMDYSRDHLRAKKAWFFTPDAVVCLGAGLHSDSILHVTTAIDQRLSRGPLIRIKKGKKEIISQKTTMGKERLFHHNIGYIMLQAMRLLQKILLLFILTTEHSLSTKAMPI